MSERIDMKALKDAAEKATPGPWAVRTCDESIGSIDALGDLQIAQAQMISSADMLKGSPIRRANTAHIAACDPQTILALVAVVEAARAYFSNGARKKERDALWQTLHPFTVTE
jgi:hypothetical protein